MDILDNKKEEIKIRLQKKTKLYFLSAIFFFIFLVSLLYSYFLLTHGTFFPLAALAMPPDSRLDLVGNLSTASFMMSILFFVIAFFTKLK